MLQNVTITPARRSLEFGIYRDGDNNLDAIQESTLSQALHTSARDSSIEFTVEDTTTLRAGRDAVNSGSLHTERYTIADGVVGNVGSGRPDEMSDEASLARFVACTLDNAQLSGAKQTCHSLRHIPAASSPTASCGSSGTSCNRPNKTSADSASKTSNSATRQKP